VLVATSIRRATGFLACLLALVVSSPAEDPAEPLTLSLCYGLALIHNEDVGIAAAEWRAAEARYRQVHDTLLPAVSVAGSAQFQNDRSEGPEDDDVPGSRAKERYDARLRAEQILYSGLRITRFAEAREAEGRAAALNERRTRELLYADVADAFYQTLIDEGDRDVLDKLVDTLQQTVEELRSRVDLGRSRKADLLSAQTGLAETLVEQETVRGRLGASRELLGFLIGRPAAEIRLAETSPFPPDPDLEAKLARATARADLLAAEALVEAATRDLQAARGERQPEIRAEGNLYAYEDPDEDREWNILLSLELPLFDEGVISERIRERAEQRQISELNLSRVRRSAESDVRTAYVSFMAAAGQRSRLREAMSVAEENYHVQKRDYELGRASQLDSLSALAQLYRLQRREVAAEMQARASLVRLHVAAGEAQP